MIAELPQQLFRLELPTPGDAVITASLSAEARRLGVDIRTGQRVLVRRTSRDPGRGIITGVCAHG